MLSQQGLNEAAATATQEPGGRAVTELGGAATEPCGAATEVTSQTSEVKSKPDTRPHIDLNHVTDNDQSQEMTCTDQL